MIPHRMLHISALICLTAALALVVPTAGNAWLYNPGERLMSGTALYGVDCPYRGSSEVLWAAQRFYLPWDADVNQLGAGLAKGYDPNGAGIRVLLVSDLFNVANTTLGSWTIKPAGPITQWYYWDTDTIRLKANQDYAMIFMPGDNVMYGSFAWAVAGLYPAQFSADSGSSWFESFQNAGAIRIGGNIVPEPQSFAVLVSASGCLFLLFFRFRLIHLNAHRKKVRAYKTRA